MDKRRVTRRDFIKATGLMTGASLLAACGSGASDAEKDGVATTTSQATATLTPLPSQSPEPIVVDCWWITTDPDLTAPWKTKKEIEASPEFGTAWYFGGYARQIFPPWLEKHPGVALKITEHSWAGALRDAMLRAIAAGQIPDTTYDEPYVTEFVRLGAYQPLPDALKSLFPESTISGALVDGKLYALPGWSGTNALFINLDVIADAGLPAERFPTTWEQLLADARQVSAAHKTAPYGNTAYYGAAPIINLDSYGTPMRVLPWFNQNRAALCDEDGNPTANSDQAVETWLWHNDLMATSSDQLLSDPNVFYEGFCNGDVAYQMGWSEHAFYVGERGTNAIAVELPLPPGGKPGNITIGNYFYAACTGGKQPELGQALITEIYTQEDNQTWCPQYIGVWIPALKSLLEQWQTYDWLDAYQTETARQMVRVTMKALLDGNARPMPPWPKNADPIWVEWNRSYQRIWEGKLEAAQIKAELDQLQRSIESLLA